jgi:hypothetical protein
MAWLSLVEYVSADALLDVLSHSAVLVLNALGDCTVSYSMGRLVEERGSRSARWGTAFPACAEYRHAPNLNASPQHVNRSGYGESPSDSPRPYQD